MSSTHSELTGETDVYYTDAVCAVEEQSVHWLSQEDVQCGEERSEANGEYVESDQISTDQESMASDVEEGEDEADEEEEDSDIVEYSEDDEVIGMDEDLSEHEDSVSGEAEEDRDETRSADESDQHSRSNYSEDDEMIMNSGGRSEGEALGGEGRNLNSDDDVVSTLTSENPKEHAIDWSIQRAEYVAGYVQNATIAHVKHSSQSFDSSKGAVQYDSPTYTTHGDIDYSNFATAHSHLEKDYTYPQNTTIAEATTFQEDFVKKPGMIRRLTDKAKVNLKDDEKRNKAIHIIQTGAQHTRFGRVISEVTTSAPEIMNARSQGKKAVGKKVAKVAVKVAVKALM